MWTINCCSTTTSSAGHSRAFRLAVSDRGARFHPAADRSAAASLAVRSRFVSFPPDRRPACRRGTEARTCWVGWWWRPAAPGRQAGAGPPHATTTFNFSSCAVHVRWHNVVRSTIGRRKEAAWSSIPRRRRLCSGRARLEPPAARTHAVTKRSKPFYT